MTRDIVRRARARLVAVAAPVLAVLVCAGIAALLVDNVAFLKYLDRFIGDWETAALLPAEPQDPDIVIVAITDETLQRFPYSAPVDRDFLSDLLTTIDARAPRAMGVDLLFNQPTEPAKDEHLRRTLDAIKAPLVVSYADEAGIVSAKQRDFLDGFVPARLRGLSALGADQFDTVRWIYPGHVGKDGRYITGFDRMLAAAVGVDTPAAMAEIVWHGRPSQAICAVPHLSRQCRRRLAGAVAPRQGRARRHGVGHAPHAVLDPLRGRRGDAARGRDSRAWARAIPPSRPPGGRRVHRKSRRSPRRGRFMRGARPGRLAAVGAARRRPAAPRPGVGRRAPRSFISAA